MNISDKLYELQAVGTSVGCSLNQACQFRIEVWDLVWESNYKNKMKLRVHGLTIMRQILWDGMQIKMHQQGAAVFLNSAVK